MAFFVSTTQKESRRKRFKDEVRRINSEMSLDELVEHSPSRLTKRQLSRSTIDQLAFIYCVVIAEQGYYQDNKHAKRLSDRLDRIEKHLVERFEWNAEE